MLAPEDITRIALREHEDDVAPPSDIEAYTAGILEQLGRPRDIPTYGGSSAPFTLVTFQCMFQDTGYPMEVYLPDDAAGPSDMSRLQERWVGWATEIIGQSDWSRHGSSRSSSKRPLPAAVHSKYPLSGLSASKGDYTGALVKIYDDVTYKPASLYTVTGILSTAALPAPMDQQSEDDLTIVPAIHVLTPPAPLNFTPASFPQIDGSDDTRASLISYLSSAFPSPDPVAAELLLLLLIASPASRPTAQPPLGTLSLNFISPGSTKTSSRIIEIIQSVIPLVVPLPLSLPVLHQAAFNPKSSDSTSLDSGILQVGQGTLLAVQEGEMGEGGTLQEKAINNLKSLAGCLTSQTVQYEYPYMDGLRMECDIKGLVFSDGKTLLPVDVHLPLEASSSASTNKPGGSPPDLDNFRAFIAQRRSKEHYSKIVIPDEVAQRIQDDFVASRQSSTRLDIEEAEARLKRRMRIARLLAQSFASAQLSLAVWEQTTRLDDETEDRMKRRQARPTQ